MCVMCILYVCREGVVYVSCAYRVRVICVCCAYRVHVMCVSWGFGEQGFWCMRVQPFDLHISNSLETDREKNYKKWKSNLLVRTAYTAIGISCHFQFQMELNRFREGYSCPCGRTVF